MNPSLIKSYLKQLNNLQTQTEAELDKISDLIAEGDFTEEVREPLQNQIGVVQDDCIERLCVLKAKFNDHAAKLGESIIDSPPTTSIAPRSASLPDLTKQVAEQLAILKAGHDYKPKITDYGFAKAQVPEFKGDMREYIKWRRQVEDYLNSYAAATSQKQAVQHLDTLTPKEIDVSRCLTLEDAWGKLTGEFGSPVYIARVLIKDFTNFVLNKFNDETKLIQLRNTMARLESHLKCIQFIKRDIRMRHSPPNLTWNVV